MEVSFGSTKSKKLCENISDLQKKYGLTQSKKIVQRINELYAAENLYDISRLPQANLHPLRGNYERCFSVDLKQPFRLIFLPLDGQKSDLKSITNIKIIKTCVNYHDK